MAQITEIKVGFGFTKSMGAGTFEFLRSDCWLTSTIDPAYDDVYEELEKLRADAREQVRKELNRLNGEIDDTHTGGTDGQ